MSRKQKIQIFQWRFVMSAVALAVYTLGVEWRQYPWQIALLISFSTVALAYSARRTFFELRRIYRAESSWETSWDRDEDTSSTHEPSSQESTESAVP